MEFFLSCFESGGKAAQGWYGWYAINIEPASGKRSLVGSGGYFGPPDRNGIVEIGYSVLPEWQRRGYATEIVKALVDRAFCFEQTSLIIAHTSPDNQASKKVLVAGGFNEIGMEEEAGGLRFELARNVKS